MVRIPTLSLALHLASFQPLPPAISQPATSSIEQRESCLTERIGFQLRDSFFLPLHHEMPPEEVIKQELGERVSRCLMDKDIRSKNLDEECSRIFKTICAEGIESIQENFSVYDVNVCLQNEVLKTFKVRVFDSKSSIHEKQLRVVLFSFYGNTVSQGNQPARRWEPWNIAELSRAPLEVLEAIQNTGVKVNSLVTTSLGNVTWAALKDLEPHRVEQIIPSTVIINRGMTSVEKAAYQLFSFPINYLLSLAARKSGWAANPEKCIAELCKQGNTQRKIIIVDVAQDHYFNNWNEGFGEQIRDSGNSVCHVIYEPSDPNPRTHHSTPCDNLKSDSKAKVSINTIPISFKENESFSATNARNVLLQDNDGVHTCFYVCGNAATLEIGTVENVLSLLSAFIAERKKQL